MAVSTHCSASPTWLASTKTCNFVRCNPPLALFKACRSNLDLPSESLLGDLASRARRNCLIGHVKSRLGAVRQRAVYGILGCHLRRPSLDSCKTSSRPSSTVKSPRLSLCKITGRSWSRPLIVGAIYSGCRWEYRVRMNAGLSRYRA